MKVRKIYILFILILSLFSCKKKEDEILKYFHNHEAAYNFYISKINTQLSEISNLYAVDKYRFQNVYNLMMSIDNYRDSLTQIINKNPDKFEMSSLSEYKKFIVEKKFSYKEDSILISELNKLLGLPIYVAYIFNSLYVIGL